MSALTFHAPAWDDCRFAAFDFEASGTDPRYALQPWRYRQGTAWVTSLAIIRQDAGKLIALGGLAPAVEMMREFLQHAINHDLTIIGWNVVYDIQWLLAYGLDDLVFQCRWLDGMLLWKHYFIEPEYEFQKTSRHLRKSYSLKSFVKERWPQYGDYAEDVDFHSEDPAERRKLHWYNIRDTGFTWMATKWLYQQLSEKRLRCALIEAECLPLVAKANLEGMVVDGLAARALQQWLFDVSKKAVAILAPHGMTEVIVRSPVKLATLLFDVWGLPVIKENTSEKTQKVTRSTDKEVLHELAMVDERIPYVRLYRESLGNEKKFATNVLKSVDYNGDQRTHPWANVFGTYTGRKSYSSSQGKTAADKVQTGFALHQMKRDKAFRMPIQPPPGFALVEFDAAGQEFRWMAIASGDETMLQLCEPGEDPHSYMGAQIAEIDYHQLITDVHAEIKLAKDQRQLGKVGNLCMAAGTRVLTDRGLCNIEDVHRHDRVWDGLEFVTHDGVVCSGYRDVMTYDGLTATPEHKVLVEGTWQPLEEAARHGWRIAPALMPKQVVINPNNARKIPRDVSTQPSKAWVYDIVNCGPRHRFAANGRIVHNSLQYRTSARTLRKVARVQYNIGMVLNEAERIRMTYVRTYRKVPVYWESQIALTKHRGYVETFGGRRVQVTGDWSGKYGWSMASTSINYRIQGTGADQKYLAIAVLRPYITQIGGYFAWDLHDGLYWYIPVAKVERAVVTMRQMLLNLPYQQAWGFTPPITLPWDCKVGRAWGALKEVKDV